MSECPSWVPDFQELIGSFALRDLILSGNWIAEHEVKLSPCHMLVSTPIYWLQTIVKLVIPVVDSAFASVDYNSTLDSLKPTLGRALKEIESRVLTDLFEATDSDAEACRQIWARFMVQASGTVGWASCEFLVGRPDSEVDGNQTYFDAGLLQVHELVMRKILHGALGITKNGHLILADRSDTRLECHDKIGLIPHAQRTCILRSKGSQFQFISNCGVSDVKELIEPEDTKFENEEVIELV